MKKLIFISILMSFTLAAQYSNLGTSGAQFLQIPLGARQAAMGGASIALTDDASSIFWNPAGLSSVSNVDFHFTNLNWFGLFDLNAAAGAYKLGGDAGVLGVHFISFSTGKIEITTEKKPNGTGRFYDAQDIALGLTYSRAITDRFRTGITVKYVSQRIWNETATGIAFDIGTQYTLDFQNLTIAMSMTNFGPDMRFDGPDLNVTYLRDENIPLSRLAPAKLGTEDFSLPLHFQVGIAMDIFKIDFVKMRAALDVTHPNDNLERVNFGTEISVFDRVFLRGGYRYNYDDEKITFGAGANLPLGESVVSFDYAYSIYDILPNVQRISVGLRF
ncbi:MAG: PorV/PorQ family protein [Ignavibacteria bacterium]|mgnify:FL=1|nr:PorV/PorQ family protein [Ignavibacteria bacterium]MCA0390009.1 PorV/PorQ family protein [Bacteroidota bacterium]